MWKLHFLMVLVLVLVPCLPSINAGTCEETETAQVKLDLAKQSISSAKLLYPKCQDEKGDSNCSAKDRSFAYLNAALDLISEAKITCHSCPETKVILPEERLLDCLDVQNKISNKSGVYEIWPKTIGSKSNQSIDVYCDMETDGGGWTVIQRRGKFEKQIDFYQDWETYKNGFGDIKKEFWLGNEKIFVITNQKNYSVRFDMVDSKREYRYALYKFFSIGDEKSGYVSNIKNHSGNATDDMQGNHNHQRFTTKDRQNDGRGSGGSCAVMYQSAFWFSNGCGFVNLNGIYKPGVNDQKSIWWYRWKNGYEGLYSVEIKIRPNGV